MCKQQAKDKLYCLRLHQYLHKRAVLWSECAGPSCKSPSWSLSRRPPWLHWVICAQKGWKVGRQSQIKLDHNQPSSSGAWLTSGWQTTAKLFTTLRPTCQTSKSTTSRWTAELWAGKPRKVHICSRNTGSKVDEVLIPPIAHQSWGGPRL